MFKVPGKQDLYIALADRWLPQKMSLCYNKYRILFERLFGSNPDMSYPPLQKRRFRTPALITPLLPITSGFRSVLTEKWPI